MSQHLPPGDRCEEHVKVLRQAEGGSAGAAEGPDRGEEERAGPGDHPAHRLDQDGGRTAGVHRAVHPPEVGGQCMGT